MAADITVDGVDLNDLCLWCSENITDYDQIISEFGEWMHIGFTLSTPRKQLLTAVKMGVKTVYNQGIA